jgi:hypothetical protein
MTLGGQACEHHEHESPLHQSGHTLPGIFGGRVQVVGKGIVEVTTKLGDLLARPGCPASQELHHLVRWQGGNEGKCRDEVGIFVPRLFDELAHLLMELCPAVLGEGVHGPLRSLSTWARVTVRCDARAGKARGHRIVGQVCLEWRW